ncbi:hypothetical protein [Arcobacter vandammei]|uniref:hypothetical protein n=1 Tax=Arcobacter vandammei TaxID=2782243 RepID=UPI0018E032A7|nr:hypothetical protein [Arcobacter vandammei]
MFKYINDKFVNSSKKTKIELYLLPILLFLSVYIFLENSKNSEDSIKAKFESNILENKKMSENILEISLKLEIIAKENEIFIRKSEKKDEEIFLEFSGSLNNIFLFLENIEKLNNFSRIKKMIFKKEEDKNIVYLNIDFRNFYIKKFEDNEKIILKEDIKEIGEIDNNEYKEDEKEIIEYEIINFEINAIVSDFAFINGVWLKKNDEINGFKLIKIFKDYVILKNENEEIKLELSYAKYPKKFD